MRNSFRVAAVGYLNARPLVHGLETDPNTDLSLDVPSRLLKYLRGGEADVALLPVIDYQRLDGLTIVPAGGIGSDGPTLTVRIFSRVPIARIRSLACDPDSHTSVALARIVLARRHDLRPEFCDLARAEKGTPRAEKGTSRISAAPTPRPRGAIEADILDVPFSAGDPYQARLLIGDKVVCDEPAGFAHQLDLGAEWKAMTGLPFVFAVWMARGGVVDHLNDLYVRLDRAKRAGLAAIDRIIREHAVPRGWPGELARQYLTKNLRFDVGPREIEAIQTFHRLAAEEQLISAARPLNVFSIG